MKNTENELTWISISTLTGYYTIERSSIKYLEASNTQTIIYLTGTPERVTSNEPLKHYEETLKEKNFIRIHKSYIINLKYLECFIKGKVAQVLLQGNIYLNVTLTYKTTLVQILESMK